MNCTCVVYYWWFTISRVIRSFFACPSDNLAKERRGESCYWWWWWRGRCESFRFCAVSRWLTHWLPDTDRRIGRKQEYLHFQVSIVPCIFPIHSNFSRPLHGSLLASPSTLPKHKIWEVLIGLIYSRITEGFLWHLVRMFVPGAMWEGRDDVYFVDCDTLRWESTAWSVYWPWLFFCTLNKMLIIQW